MPLERNSPNIILIFTDQHRHDVLGCSGHSVVSTPHLDAMAAQGMHFTNVWNQGPVCRPSRASFITGQYPATTGVLANFSGEMHSRWPTFMKMLQRQGYQTATVGKTHYYNSRRGFLEQLPVKGDLRSNAGRVKDFGWDYVVEEFDKPIHTMPGVKTPYTEYLRAEGLLNAYCDQVRTTRQVPGRKWEAQTSVLEQEHDLTRFLTREAIRFLDQECEPNRPFFLKLAYVQPHVPLIDDPQWAAYYRDAEIPLDSLVPPKPINSVWERVLARLAVISQQAAVTESQVREGRRHYFGMVSLIDQCVGEISNYLKTKGLDRNTWIIYTSDHGEMLGDHSLWAKGNFYHASVQVPLIIRPPRALAVNSSAEPVELLDVTATILDLAGARYQDSVAGRSLLPVLEGASAGRDYQYSMVRQPLDELKMGDFIAVRDEQYRVTVEAHSRMLCEIFDMQNDPDELDNLVEDTRYRQIAGDMARQIALPFFDKYTRVQIP